jgi:hypothetical protein
VNIESSLDKVNDMHQDGTGVIGDEMGGPAREKLPEQRQLGQQSWKNNRVKREIDEY